MAIDPDLLTLTLTAFTGWLKSQPLAEAVMVMVTSHGPTLSRPIDKPDLLIHLMLDDFPGS